MQERGFGVFGPTREAAMLETSKAHAKRFMQRHTIPTAADAVCESRQEAQEALEMFHLPVVIKADGLASGKGVLICEETPRRNRRSPICSAVSCLVRSRSRSSSKST